MQKTEGGEEEDGWGEGAALGATTNLSLSNHGMPFLSEGPQFLSQPFMGCPHGSPRWSPSQAQFSLLEKEPSFLLVSRAFFTTSLEKFSLTTRENRNCKARPTPAERRPVRDVLPMTTFGLSPELKSHIPHLGAKNEMRCGPSRL